MPADLAQRAFDLHRRGRLDEAAAAYREALAGSRVRGDLWRGLGLCLFQQGDREAATDALVEALRLDCSDADALSLSASMHVECGRLDRAQPQIEALKGLRPGDAFTALLAGEWCERRGEVTAAEAELRRAVAIDSRLAKAWFLLGVVLHRQQRWEDALEAYRRVAQLGARPPNLDYNLGLCLENLGRLDEALQCYRSAVASAPLRAQAWARLAGALAQACAWEEQDAAVEALERSLKADDQAGDDLVEPFQLLFLPLSRPARDRALDRYVAALVAETADSPRPRLHARAAGVAPLRVGYLSPDFGEHAVGTLLRDLFAAHDRSQVEVTGYSLRQHQGPTATAIRAGCDRFVEVHDRSSGDIAAAVAGDGVDILVDLGGYTLGARPQVLALRAAPLQLGWLGFIHDYRAPFLDYLVLDEVLAPPGSEAAFGTALARLPGCALPGCALPAPDPQARRSNFGLPEDVFLFASFNNSYKLDAELFDAWAEIARRARQAHFAVFAGDGAAALSSAWRARGLPAERLHLLARLPLPAQMSRMSRCDLFLDAFRYQAGATGVAAAAAGLPLLSREGCSPVARLGVSINRFLGLDALVAGDRAAYVDTAVAMANDPTMLAAVRAQLAAAVPRSGLLDPCRSAAALEGLYRRLWDAGGWKARSRASP